MTAPANTLRLPAAFWCGLAAIAAASGLAAIDLRLAAVPLALFVLACFTAPFLPWLGFFLPVISRGNTGKPLVALTFDDGPDPATTPALLALLETENISATFFVTGRKAQRHPNLMRAILAAGHSVGNHTYCHSFMALVSGPQALEREITDAQKALAPFGIRPRAFRPPVGITTPGLGRILKRLELYTVNFRFRALDGGNRRLHHLARVTLKRVRGDDILMLHDLKPAHGRSVARWLAEVKQLVAGLRQKGLTIVPLETLIGRPVMELIP
jgi:peptidoglycan/xylan/chitin deacetylase (PgdA/CDA1 family)